jgi:EpsI family protein
MRDVSRLRLTILCVLLLVTALLVHGTFGKNTEAPIKEPLQHVFARIKGLQPAGTLPMDPRIVEELKVDDYLFQSYGRDSGHICLYIGYYRSAKKVGAAHDPLVCFQGQGWKIIKRETGEYVFTQNPAMGISYATMIAERQDDRQVILYWFQANGKAYAKTYQQKTAMAIDKLLGRNEENAFVRLSAPIGAESPEAVRKRLFDFIEAFYPEFYRYVTSA